MASKLDKHKDEIVELCKQGLAYEKIGKKFGVSGVAVSYWCQINGIKKVKCRLGKGLKLDKHKDEIVDFCKQGLKYKEIGEKFGVSLQTVLRWCQKKGIDKVKCKGGFPSKLDKHKDEIIELCKQGLAYKEIREKFGVSWSAVREWCKINGIEKVNCSRVSKLDKYKDEIIEMCKQGLPYPKIANKFGVSWSAVRKWCKINGIEKVKCVRVSKLDQHRDEIVELWKQGLIYKEIGEKFGVGLEAAYKWCKKNGIKTVNCGHKTLTVNNKRISDKPCEICGFDRGVQRAHIIEDANGGTKKDGNILYLCPNHHYLFDRGLLTKEEFYSLDFSKKDLKSSKYAMRARVKQHKPFWNTYKKDNE